jgi:Alpha/beta hydrolase domain
MAFEKRIAHRRITPAVSRRKLLYVSVVGALAATAALVAPTNVDARITKIVVSTKESPTFGGYSFAGIGQYEKIAGMAFGELDPNDPKNAVIVDIALAPRNANGKVEYSHTFYILKPIDLSKGSHRVMYEPPNRGGKTVATLNRGVGGDDPGAVTDPTALANSFLMPRGYTLVFTGWDQSAGTSSANFNSMINLPIAKNPGGSSITGPAYEYIVMGNATTQTYVLNYPANSLDKAQAKLTTRKLLNDTPTVVPASGWDYVDAKTIRLLPAPTAFNASDIYEFSYTAKDPTVNGVGFAAVRDFNAWLRYASADDFGTANPMAGDIRRIYTEISSQPGRMLNDFRWLGFNQAETGQKVFDGMMQWVAAGDGINMNYRFSSPGRTERNRQDHLYVEGRFPFANVITTDPITGKTDGRYRKCDATVTCPYAMEFYSSNEYWVKPASLFHTDPTGTVDLPDHPQTRLYLLSGKQHGGAGSPNSKGNCQQFLNPLDSAPVQRALWEDMVQWVENGVAPPPSQVPTLAKKTMVPPLPQSGVGFPNIPGVTYNGLQTTRYLFNYGPGFYDTGVATINPPVITLPYQNNAANGPIYTSYVPTTDADGNEIAGIRLPEVRVPLQTYTGWALRSAANGLNDGCEGSGQRIPFPTTKAARTASGDPRLSIEERYPNFLDYYYKVSKAVNDMVAERFILAEDAPGIMNKLLNDGFATGAIKMAPDDEE